MNRITRASGLALAVGFALHFGAPPAHADFTLEERIEIGGALKFANMSGRTVTTIAGDRARTESELKMESKLMRMFAKDTGPTAEIVRLDQEKVYTLELKKKEYTEMTFAEMRAAWEKSLQQAQQAQKQAQEQAQEQAQQQQGSGVPVDQSRCEWSEPRADVRRSGEKATFGGFEGEHVTIAATQTCTDKETGSVCDFALTIDQWLAPGFPAEAEAMKFYQAYAEKMGLSTALSRDASQRAESLFGSYTGLWSEVGTKMRDVKGYPLKTTFGMAVGGPKCQTAQQGGADDSQSGGTPPTGADMQEAAATAAGETAGQVAAEQAGESTLGGIAGKIGGKLGGSLFGKKKKEQAAASADATAAAATSAPAAAPATAAPTAATGMLNVIGMSVELVSLKRDAASPSAFEIPAGFKKAANQ